MMQAILAEFIKSHRATQVATPKAMALGLWSYGGFKLTGSGYPTFSAPPSGESVRQSSKIFRRARTRWRSSIAMPSLMGLGFHPPPGRPKTLSFLSVCLLVCLLVRYAFERQRLCARFHHEGVGVQKRF